MRSRLKLGAARKFLPRIIGEENRSDFRRSSQLHILRQDLHLGVMPIGGLARNHANFEVDIVGQDKDAAIQILSQFERVNRREIKESICDVANHLAQNITHSGITRYEISSIENGYSLDYIPERSFYDLNFVGVQFVPKLQREHVNKRVIVGSSKRIWKISFPKSLHSRKQYIKVLKHLSKYTNLIPQQIELGDIDSPEIGFDMNYYNRESKKFIYQLLNKIGGAQRETRLDYVTEYYLINRMIRLNLTRSVIREHVICEINNLFKKLRFDALVEVNGLPTSQGISDCLSDLKVGAIGLDEAYKKTSVN